MDDHASEIVASGSLGSKGFPERATLSMALSSLRMAMDQDEVDSSDPPKRGPLII